MTAALGCTSGCVGEEEATSEAELQTAGAAGAGGFCNCNTDAQCGTGRICSFATACTTLAYQGYEGACVDRDPPSTRGYTRADWDLSSQPTWDLGGPVSLDLGTLDERLLCSLCIQDEHTWSAQERFACTILNAGVGAIIRAAASSGAYNPEEDATYEQLICLDPNCPPSTGRIGHGFSGRAKFSNLLDGEVGGSLKYGFGCGRWDVQVEVFGDDIFGGSQAEFGAFVTMGTFFGGRR